jgi:hypothetical protein
MTLSLRSVFTSTFALVAFSSAFIAGTEGVAQPWQINFQTPASPIAEGIVAFHDDLRIFLTGILCFVRYILAVLIHRYTSRESTTGKPVDRLVHASTLEIV